MSITYRKSEMDHRDWLALQMKAEENERYEPLTQNGETIGYVEFSIDELMDEEEEEKDARDNEGENYPPGYNSEGNPWGSDSL